MPNLRRITDPGDPSLAEFRDLKDAPLRPGKEGFFIAEGDTVVRALLASPYQTRSILLTPQRLRLMRDAIDPLADHTEVLVADPAIVEQVVGFAFHRGVLAVGRRGPQPDPRQLAAHAPALVIAEDLTNVDNLGALFRCVSALAPAGCAILLSPACCDPLYRKAVRVSMGHVLHVPWARIPEGQWPAFLAELAPSLRTIALTPSAAQELAAIPADHAGHKTALVLGAEGPGLSGAALAACTAHTRIGMRPGVDSLNVVVAAALALRHLFPPA